MGGGGAAQGTENRGKRGRKNKKKKKKNKTAKHQTRTKNFTHEILPFGDQFFNYWCVHEELDRGL